MASLLDPNVRMRARGKALRPWWKWRFASFGDGSVLVAPRWIVGAHKIEIGAGTRIFRGAWLAAEPSTWSSPEPGLSIGRGCTIRDDVVLSASERVVIEDNVGISGRVLVIDSDHTWSEGSAFVSDNLSVTSPVRIGEGTWIGEQSIVLRGTDIGRFCLIAANSVVRGTFPDYSIIAGTPAKAVGSTRRHLHDSLLDEEHG